MIYLVIFLLAVIILLLFFILRLKSKETFVLDNSSNKPKIDNYNLDNYSYLTEVKKFEIIHNEIKLSKEEEEKLINFYKKNVPEIVLSKIFKRSMNEIREKILKLLKVN
jgi:hypothetical protein